MAKIQNIRVSISDKNQILHEIFKISLAPNKNDFLLVKRNGDIKITFHEKGKKYLRFLKTKENHTLYNDLHYDAQNLNPIFAYLPKNIESYKLFEEGKKSTAEIKIFNESSFDNLLIKVYWVNYKDGGLYVSKNDKNISKFEISGNEIDGTPFKDEAKLCLLDFGHQKLYFDFCKIVRKNFDATYESIFLFKPGVPIDISKYLLSIKPPYHKNKIEKFGYELHKNKKDDTYLISF